MGKLTIRKGKEEDIDQLLKIFDSARKFMRVNNNFSQWSDTYPGRDDILSDMAKGNNYVGTDEEGEIVMTFTFILGEDPTYKIIKDGEWLNEDYYGTIHRMASNGKVSRVLQEACEYGFHLVKNIRIDTHEDNKPMQKALSRLGFIRCGIINCRDGSPRIAFQKSL